MNTPWIIGVAVAVAFFAIFEAYALRHPDRQNTLSACVRAAGTRWPFTIWVMGMFAGGMGVHLFLCVTCLTK